jgi:hypothetical protein
VTDIPSVRDGKARYDTKTNLLDVAAVPCHLVAVAPPRRSKQKQNKRKKHRKPSLSDFFGARQQRESSAICPWPFDCHLKPQRLSVTPEGTDFEGSSKNVRDHKSAMANQPKLPKTPHSGICLPG